MIARSLLPITIHSVWYTLFYLKERITPHDGIDEPRPPYDRIARGLTALLATAGVAVAEGFPAYARRFAPQGPMVDYDHATRTLLLHPWIPPRARAAALLHQAVMSLTEQQPKKRGRKADETRRWAVEAAAARHYGLPVDEADRPDIELTALERSLVGRIVAAVAAAGGEGGAPPAS